MEKPTGILLQKWRLVPYSSALPRTLSCGKESKVLGDFHTCLDTTKGKVQHFYPVIPFYQSFPFIKQVVDIKINLDLNI